MFGRLASFLGILEPTAKHVRSVGSRLRNRRLRLERLEGRRLLACFQVGENWIDAGGGCQDVATGLVWSQSTQDVGWGVGTYGPVVTWVDNLTQGGYTDWRMPTKNELLELAGHGGRHNVTPNTYNIWSSDTTRVKNKDSAWVVNLFDGGSGLYGTSAYANGIGVRGTRNSQSPTQPNVHVYSPTIMVAEPGNTYTGPFGDREYFHVALDTPPTANVTFSVASSDTTQGTLDVTQVTFTPTNWNVPQFIAVRGVDNAILDIDEQFMIVTGSAVSSDPLYNGLGIADVQVTNVDNERPFGVDVSLGWQTSEDGAGGSYGAVVVQLTLGAEPQSGPVHVTISPADASELSTSVSQLTFTAANWNVAQSFTVVGLPDGVPDGDVWSTIQLAVAADSGSSADFLGVNAVGPNIKNIDRDGVVRTYTSGVVNKAIPDPGTATSTIVVGDTGTVLDVNVTLNINHTWDSDLRVMLRGPNGLAVVLLDRNGGSGDNFTATKLDDEASTNLSAGSAPFTGTFLPNDSRPSYEVLSPYFDGIPANGNWTLEVQDVLKRYTGKLVSWSLEMRLDSGSSSLAATVMGPGAQALTAAEAHRTVDAALAILGSPGGDRVSIEIVDLPPGQLAQAVDHTLQLDVDANGIGWFVDSTPGNQREFDPVGGYSWIARPQTGAAGRYDLLTAVLHELGHLDGLGHNGESASVMHETLSPGKRRLPDPAEASTRLSSEAVTGFHAKLDSVGNFELAKALPGAVNAFGDLFVVGEFSGTAGHNPRSPSANLLPPPDDPAYVRGFLLKPTASGDCGYALTVAPGDATWRRIARTPDGRLVLAGSMNGSVEFDPDAVDEAILTADSDAVLWNLLDV